MRIGIFSDTYPPEINGVATVCGLLYKIFTEHGHEVFIVTTGQYNKEEKFVIEGNVIRISSKAFKHLYNYRKAPLYRSKVAKYIKSLNLDVIHVHTEIGIGLFGRLLAKMNHIPLVYTYHTLYEDYTYYVTHGHKLFDKFAKRVVVDLSVFLSDTSTEFTTTSIKTKNTLRRYGVKKYINVIPNGIDLSLFTKFDQTKVEEFRKQNNLEDKFVLLILGRLAQEKSNDIVLHNVGAYIRKNGKKNLVLYVVGDGPDKENLMKISHDEGLDDITTFVGPVDHDLVPLYYHAADLFLSASTTETQGLTFIEAMASKALVLAKKDECLNDVIIPGETGYFYEDQEGFILMLSELVNYSKEQLENVQNKACDLISKKYSAETFYEEMLHVYQRAWRKYW
ncbi:MAG TPA: hypothetical protein DCY93_03375 [Firmicutes bacterium]|nr:hypothetical protein [Bacillota bacterium]